MQIKAENTKNNTNIPESWDDTDLGDFVYKTKPKKEMSFSTRFFLISVVFFVLASGFLAFSIFKNYSSFSEKYIDFTFSGPASLSSGQSENFDLSVNNKNSIPISEAYILVEYNSGENANGDQNPISEKIELGQILSKSATNTKSEITLFGSEGDTKDIKATLFYKVAGSNADFNKSATPLKILLKSSPVTIAIDSLNEFRKNSLNTITISIKNNTQVDMKNVIASARVPNDFVLASSSLKLYTNSPSWIIPNLPALSETKISFSGKLTGDIGQIDGFSFYVGKSNNNLQNSSSSIGNYDNYNLNIQDVYSQTSKNITISGQYLDVSVDSNNSDTVLPGELINLDFNYKNNLNYPITNALFLVQLSGDFDKQGLQVLFAKYDVNAGTITWDSNTLAELAFIPANGTGKFKLQIRASKKIPLNGSDIDLKMYARADRSSESSVSNEQDMSFEKKWTISSN